MVLKSILISCFLFFCAYSQHSDAAKEKQAKEGQKSNTIQIIPVKANVIAEAIQPVKIKPFRQHVEDVLIQSGTSTAADLPTGYKTNFRQFMVRKSDKKAPLKPRKKD
ncbi:MAG: hypothetical protein KDD94_06345 [Calditrichaeota bacterium]|nr:hypothetical protein [Calditrichota bacterium]